MWIRPTLDVGFSLKAMASDHRTMSCQYGLGAGGVAQVPCGEDSGGEGDGEGKGDDKGVPLLM